MSNKATTDKTRTIEAATGQVDTNHILQIGEWTVGYLSLKNSELRKLEQLEESKKYTALLDAVYPFFLKRFIGDNPPSQEEFEDATDLMDVRVFVAWMNGLDAEEARKAFADPTKDAQ